MRLGSRTDTSAQVLGQIAIQADSAAIRALLSNRSAAIQKATLDALIGQARPHPDWHGPLVQRPVLTPHTVEALSGFVAAQLIEVLSRRADLDPAATTELRRQVATRLLSDAAPTPATKTSDLELLASLRHLHAAYALNEAALIDAARTGNQRRVATMLAVASGLALAAVDRAAALRNAKALISLVWKAGFTMRAAMVVQRLLGQLGPDVLIFAGPDAGFPLTADEIQ